MLIVGAFGLTSNILGLVLFHEHGHSHGDHQGHSHAANDQPSTAEEGQGELNVHTQIIADEGGNIEDVLPRTIVGSFTAPVRKINVSTENSKDQSKQAHQGHKEESTAVNPPTPTSERRLSTNSTWRHGRRTSGSRSRYPTANDIYPPRFRNEVIAAGRAAGSRLDDIDSATSSESDAEEASQPGSASEHTPLLTKAKSHGSSKDADQPAAPHSLETGKSANLGHEGHKHAQPKKQGQKGHKHGDLNMRGIFLHVLGDALGNIGVMGSALIIGLTDYSWRFYSDPVISLIITFIILGSAIPLCLAASRILLQAVPEHISIDDIRHDIQTIEGVLSCHSLHVWQLSEGKIVASLHIEVDYDFEGEGSAQYMRLANKIIECLHAYGIHSSTIQPEFCLDKDHGQATKSTGDDEGLDTNRGSSAGTSPTSKNVSRAGSIRNERNACLLKCGDKCEGLKREDFDEDGQSHR